MQEEGMGLSETTLDRLIQMLDLTDAEAEQLRKTLAGVGDTGYDSVQQVQDRMEGGLLKSIGSVNAALGFLDQKLRSATSSEKRNRIQQLIADLKELKREMEETGDSTSSFEKDLESLGRAGVSALAQGLGQIGAAIGNTEKELASFGDVAKQIIGEIAKALGQKLLAMAAATAFSNPGLAAAYAASGATLIGIGATLTSRGSITEGGGASDGAGGEPQEGQIQGGGEASAELDAPGRRTGGPVRGGQLYETHGLGQREYFIPDSDGAIVTQDSMRAIAASSEPAPRRLDVSVRADGGIDMNGPREFARVLRPYLNEIEAEFNERT